MFLRSAAERRSRQSAAFPPAGDVDPVPSVSWKPRARIVALVLAAWAVVGILQANVIYVIRIASHTPSSPLIEFVSWSLAGVAVWALFTPLVVWLARVFPITGAHPVRNGAIHVVLSLVNHVAISLVLLPIRESAYPRNPLYAKLTEGTLWDISLYIAVVALAHAWWLQQDSRMRKEEALRLEAQLARSRFEALTLQLQPHFLFNSLNAISELVYRDPKLADYALTKLAELLRRALASSGQIEGTLEEEMRFLDAYAEIERLRSGGVLRLEWDVPAETRRLAVPVLLLQPLVENAFRHGIRDGGGDRVDVSARIEDGTLRITIQDNGRGFGVVPAHEGLGLRNTRERLESLYGSRGAIELMGGHGQGVRVEIALPARSLVDRSLQSAPARAVTAPEYDLPAGEAVG
jgi:two-component sensor histidine kinase